MRFVTGVGALGAAACLMLPCLILPMAAMSAEMRGVTKTEIKIGQTMPYSGPVSAFGRSARARSAISKWSTSAAASTGARST